MNKDREAFACANYIIEKLHKYEIRDVTNLKLQKLLYFAYGVHLSLYNERLFTSAIQAWQFGPAIPCVYQEFKNYGNNPISLKQSVIILKDDCTGDTEVPKIDEDSMEPKTRSLSIACAAYGYKKAWDLVNITHGEKSAWHKWYKSDKGGQIIPDEDVKLEFEQYMDILAQYLLD